MDDYYIFLYSLHSISYFILLCLSLLKNVKDFLFFPHCVYLLHHRKPLLFPIFPSGRIENMSSTLKIQSKSSLQIFLVLLYFSDILPNCQGPHDHFLLQLPHWHISSSKLSMVICLFLFLRTFNLFAMVKLKVSD